MCGWWWLCERAGLSGMSEEPTWGGMAAVWALEIIIADFNKMIQ